MNNIKTDIDKSDYDNYPDFINIQIDDIWLDEFLDHLQPDKSIKNREAYKWTEIAKKKLYGTDFYQKKAQQLIAPF